MHFSSFYCQQFSNWYSGTRSNSNSIQQQCHSRSRNAQVVKNWHNYWNHWILLPSESFFWSNWPLPVSDVKFIVQDLTPGKQQTEGQLLSCWKNKTFLLRKIRLRPLKRPGFQFPVLEAHFRWMGDAGGFTMTFIPCQFLRATTLNSCAVFLKSTLPCQKDDFLNFWSLFTLFLICSRAKSTKQKMLNSFPHRVLPLWSH